MIAELVRICFFPITGNGCLCMLLTTSIAFPSRIRDTNSIRAQEQGNCLVIELRSVQKELLPSFCPNRVFRRVSCILQHCCQFFTIRLHGCHSRKWRYAVTCLHQIRKVLLGRFLRDTFIEPIKSLRLLLLNCAHRLLEHCDNPSISLGGV